MCSSDLGVTPAQYPEYAALRGDASDNLPGVPGIGEKTAAKLVTTYGDLDGIFANLDQLPPKQRANLAEWETQVRHNHEMSVLRRDVELGVGVGDLRFAAFEIEPARQLFHQLEFRSLFPRVLAALRVEDSAGTDTGTLDVEVETIHDPASVDLGAMRGSEVAWEPVWSGTGRSRTVDALALATAERTTVLLRSALADEGVRTALVGLLDRKSTRLNSSH